MEYIDEEELDDIGQDYYLDDYGGSRGNSKGDILKGAVKEGTKEGVKEGIKGAERGAEKGSEVGSKIGGSIPYVGKVTGPIGGVVGGAVGGGLGAAGGGAKGAAKGAKAGAKDAKNRSKANKFWNNLWDNIKGAINGNKKDIILLAIKGTFFIVIGILIFIALIIEGDAKETSGTVFNVVQGILSESVSEVNKELFNKTGSLIIASDNELDRISDKVMETMKATHTTIYDDLGIEYSNKNSYTVANKVMHITTNLTNNETTTVEKIEKELKNIDDQASLKQKRTILEHILRAEKYNFNNIIWRSFVKDKSNKLKEESIKFEVDNETKLKYPSEDPNDIDVESHDLIFFVNKTRSYLQSWYIPFDLLIGTIDSGTDQNINTKFAYEILASAYHEVVVDRYKVETLTRNTNYIVYDKISTTTTVTRTCAEYDVDGNTRVYCSDSKAEDVQTTNDFRENIKTTDTTSYRWDYVVSMAKMFDNIIAQKYEFVPYSKYSSSRYDNYINKKEGYTNLSVEQFKESEAENSKSDSFSHTEKEYYKKDTQTKVNSNWNSSYLGKPPAGAKKIGTETSKIISEIVIEEKKGKEYTDVYVWNDRLELSEYKTGIYNVDSVKDVTGNDLSSYDLRYYTDLYYGKEINLVDLMNSDKAIYSNYLSTSEMSQDTQNIGISKERLSLTYTVLRDDLNNVLQLYPLNSIKYGQSLGLDTSSFAVLNGVSFGSVENIAAGTMEGKNVAYPISSEDLSNSHLQVNSKFGNSYGYAGHTGVDISYNYSAADKSLCDDYSNRVCPYMKGPEIYTMMDGIIKAVGYSAYNIYHKEGMLSGESTEGDLMIDSGSPWGTYVKIQNTDGSYTIYAHLFPDKEFYKQMSQNIGKPVTAGTFIGYMGNTGNSSGLHLHIEFAKSMSSFGVNTANSSNTYIYIMKIIDAMKINPPKS